MAWPRDRAARLAAARSARFVTSCDGLVAVWRTDVVKGAGGARVSCAAPEPHEQQRQRQQQPADTVDGEGGEAVLGPDQPAEVLAGEPGDQGPAQEDSGPDRELLES